MSGFDKAADIVLYFQVCRGSLPRMLVAPTVVRADTASTCEAFVMFCALDTGSTCSTSAANTAHTASARGTSNFKLLVNTAHHTASARSRREHVVFSLLP